MNRPAFHGSYRAQDVEFLLKPLGRGDLNMPANVEEKEALIQSGQRHYSEMLTPESLPSEAYCRLFFAALARNGARMAAGCLTLAQHIAANVSKPVLLSLARAGTPVGVIVAHILRWLTGQAVPHYSLSIIRDRGIDANALDAVLARGAAPQSLVFIDGWTGKGVIADELQAALAAYNERRGAQIAPRLWVLADLAGKAYCAASREDYLMPSAILNATVSGLVSRSVLNAAIGADDFHGCLFYGDDAAFVACDVSVWFVDDLLQRVRALLQKPQNNVPLYFGNEGQQQRCADFLAAEMARYGVADRNLIKPGIGEATRVLLRRLPQRVVVKSQQHADVQHLLALAREKGVPVEARPDLPLVQALAIIKGNT